MNYPLRVIGVVIAPPKGEDAPASTCDQCAYYQPLFDSACQGHCRHTWSDHVDDLVFSHQSCIQLTVLTDYDPCLDASQDAATSYAR